ncbi:hypothetical protein ASE26_08565 [Duganella sp. Root198D2]|nr:hypothetical protein ASD07_01900 [Duganella sp. Root336D2]KRB84130.1 hypothetical protein ASE26_08565 [Duganella sp. Root198D2]
MTAAGDCQNIFVIKLFARVVTDFWLAHYRWRGRIVRFKLAWIVLYFRVHIELYRIGILEADCQT